jgi:hypothetical protein
MHRHLLEPVSLKEGSLGLYNMRIQSITSKASLSTDHTHTTQTKACAWARQAYVRLP